MPEIHGIVFLHGLAELTLGKGFGVVVVNTQSCAWSPGVNKWVEISVQIPLMS